MDLQNCYLCQKRNVNLCCQKCTEPICKSCARFLDEGCFSFFKVIPKDLSHTTYCEPCFHNTVEPETVKYNELIEQAKNIAVFEKKQGKETRLISRKEPPIEVKNCEDHDEALLRLAFQAVQKGFNAIIDVELISQKIRTGSYQTTSWNGKAVPTDLENAKLVKDRSIWSNPN